MSRRVHVFIALALVAVATVPSGVGAAPSYLRPVVVDGHVFPVVRSNWYSVINFKGDWHAPRMRFERGRWRLVGFHEGNDVFAEPGTPIVSITGGTIENLGWLFYSGWRVGVRGDDGRYWFYAHMRRFAPGLSVGQWVEPGTVLGEVGNTGYGENEGHDDEFAHHLHLGIQEASGAWSDPYPLLKRLYRAAVKL
jgi:murein DD-endopeptidase MepM/ murein hydrolase activator NlpD